MKISELVASPAFKGVDILAGKSGMYRQAGTVNMMDAPDIIPYLKENELLITTAYHMKDNPGLLMDLIRAMAAKNCAALGIKTKRYLNKVPKEAIKLADQLELPIIDLPMSLSLGEIAFEAMEVIMNKRSNELIYAMEIHKQLTQIIISGKGIRKLLSTLSHLVGSPVYFLNHHFNPVLSDIGAGAISAFLLTLRKAGFRLPESQIATFSIIETKQTYSFFPVYKSKTSENLLIVKGDTWQSGDLNTLIMEQAANVLSFALMKESVIKQFNRSVRNDFLSHFLEGTYSNETEIINRAKEFSLHASHTYFCAVGKWDGANTLGSFTLHQQKIESLYEWMEEEISHRNTPIHFFTRGEQCILLYEVKGMSVESSAFFESILTDIQESISLFSDDTLSFGMSSLCQNLLYIPKAYKEAETALKDGIRLKKKNFIEPYRMKDILEMLRALPEEDLKSFYDHTLRGFRSLNREEEETLLQTLSVYLDTQCQISETAKRLFVHRNTVVYRLEKCEDILGENIKDSEIALRIRLAIKVKQLLDL